jgi:hypothetical protein
MSDLRFHISGARFRSFPARFPALGGIKALRFRFVSMPFPTDTVRFQFPAYIRATANEACSRRFSRPKIIVLSRFCVLWGVLGKLLTLHPYTTHRSPPWLEWARKRKPGPS